MFHLLSTLQGNLISQVLLGHLHPVVLWWTSQKILHIWVSTEFTDTTSWHPTQYTFFYNLSFRGLLWRGTVLDWKWTMFSHTPCIVESNKPGRFLRRTPPEEREPDNVFPGSQRKREFIHILRIQLLVVPEKSVGFSHLEDSWTSICTWAWECSTPAEEWKYPGPVSIGKT